MTKSTALQITSSNDTTISENKKVFRCPVTASEAYNLGMTMEKVLAEIYTDLETKCQSLAAKKMLQDFVNQSHLDVADLFESFKFALNCEIDKFYRTGGVVLTGDITEEKMAQIKPLIARNMDNFFNKINTIQNDLKNKANDELGEYFNARSRKDVYEICKDVRNNSIELYGRLAKLYPDGEIKNAFEEMAQIILVGSLRLKQKS